MKTFQQLLRSLSEFWEQQGCLIHQGYDLEMGAGTFNPATFLRCLGPEPYRAAYIEPSRRPTDGRYGKNPNRLQHYFQYQVILKPSPPDIQTLYLASLQAIGLDLSKHDIRFVHDDWESPTLGAWGLGWETWIDGMEVSQITYFQSVGGIEVKPVTGEITYGLERLAMFLQQKDSCYAIRWSEEYTYGDLYQRNEFEWSAYHFEEASPEMWFRHFDDFEREAASLLEKRLPLPAYDFVIKASHAFNILDARGVISVTERTGYIGRIRNLARRTAACYIESREELGHPLLKKRLPSRRDKLPDPQVKEEPPLKQADFLLEIGSEELPAGFVPIGLNSLEKLLRELLEKHEIAHGEMRLFGTPRRLAILVRDVSPETEEKRRERRGPSLQKAFDSEGALTLIGRAFLKSVGIDAATLQGVKEGSIPSLEARGEHLFFTEIKPPEKSLDILSKELSKLILSLEFPKKMRWADYEISYARPILWIAALMGSSVIPFSLENLSSGRTSYGHRQLSPASFLLEKASDYPETLKKRSVLACQKERRASIEEQLQEVEEKLGAQALEKERVISEVLYLVENPFLTYAAFDSSYLKAPKELLVSEMVEHQRYFPLADEKGSLLHLFVITANNHPSDAIKRGNEHVLAARLADGLFLYEQDLKSSLNELNEKLRSITFQKELGSVWDKVERLSKHVKVLLPYFKEADQEKALAAALYCKADLASHVVGEFPELQGVMGRVYAEKAGHSREAALAIEEHWLPKREEGPLPETVEGALLSLADKLDNLLAFFGIGLPPSSSKDPHGLRRQVLGMIKLLIRQRRRLPLRSLLEACYDHFPEGLLEKKEAVVPKILEFITNRIKTVFLDYHVRKDEIEASLSFTVHDIYDTYLRVEALRDFRKEQRGFEELYEVYKRTQGQIQSFPSLRFDPSLLVKEAEKELYRLLNSLEEPFREALAEKNYREAYHRLREIQPALAQLFEEVKILDEDEAVRNNRIALLQQVFFFFERLLDFSKIKLS